MYFSIAKKQRLLNSLETGLVEIHTVSYKLIISVFVNFFRLFYFLLNFIPRNISLVLQMYLSIIICIVQVGYTALNLTRTDFLHLPSYTISFP